MKKKKPSLFSKKPERFGGVYLDLENLQLFFNADAPPLGRIRMALGSRAFSIDAHFEDDDANDEDVEMVVEDVFDPSKAEPAIRELDDLAGSWPVLWPLIYNALMEFREENECEESVTANNCMFVLCPPDDSQGVGFWRFFVELEEWDGYWTIEFDPQGNILERNVTY